MAFRLASAFVDITTRDRGLRGGFAGARQFIGGAAAQMAKLAAGAAALGTGAAFAAAGFGIKLAADMEQAEIAFTTMLGTADRAKKLLADLDQFAAQTPFQLPGIIQSARNLVAFGVEQQKILPTLKALGDVSAGIGAPLEQIAELFGKAKVQGRLFQEDINQLTGRGIPIIQELAKQFNVTESEVKALVSSGEVNFQNLERAFISLTSEGGKFAGLMESQSRSLAGRWSTFKDNVSKSLREVGQVLIETFDLKGLLERATVFVQEFGPRVSTGLRKFAAFAQNIFGFIGARFGDSAGTMSENFVNFLGATFANLRNFVMDAAEWFAVLGSNWETAIELLKSVWDQFIIFMGDRIEHFIETLPARFENVSKSLTRKIFEFFESDRGFLINPTISQAIQTFKESESGREFIRAFKDDLNDLKEVAPFQLSEEFEKASEKSRELFGELRKEKQALERSRIQAFKAIDAAAQPAPAVPEFAGGGAGAAAAQRSRKDAKGGFIALDQLNKRIQQQFLEQNSPEMKQVDLLEKQLDKQEMQIREEKEAQKVLNRIEIQLQREQRVILREATA